MISVRKCDSEREKGERQTDRQTDRQVDRNREIKNLKNGEKKNSRSKK